MASLQPTQSPRPESPSAASSGAAPLTLSSMNGPLVPTAADKGPQPISSSKSPLVPITNTTLETSQVPVSKTVLVEHSFKGGEFRGSRELATLGIQYASVTRKRETITMQAAAENSEALAQGNAVTARTNRRGYPVATITPQMRDLPLPRALEPNSTPAKATTPAPAPRLRNENEIFSSLTAPLFARSISQSIGAAIKDLLTETPAEKAQRLADERRAEEAKLRELQTLQQAALTEKNELTAKIAQRPDRTNAQRPNADLSFLASSSSSENAAAIRTAIATGETIEAQLSNETTAETAKLEPNAADLSKLTESFKSLATEATEMLKEAYQGQGAQGRFLSSILESLTSPQPSLTALQDSQIILTSAPTMFQSVIEDILHVSSLEIENSSEQALNPEAERISYSEQAELSETAPFENSTFLNTELLLSNEPDESSQTVTPFSRYRETTGIDDTFYQFSFSADLRESLAA